MPRKAYFISKDWKNSIVSREWRGLRMETKSKKTLTEKQRERQIYKIRDYLVNSDDAPLLTYEQLYKILRRRFSLLRDVSNETLDEIDSYLNGEANSTIDAQLEHIIKLIDEDKKEDKTNGN